MRILERLGGWRRSLDNFRDIPVPGLTNRLRPLPVLSAADEERVHASSLRILSEVGLVFEEPRALEVLERAGARVDRSAHRACLDPDWILHTVSLAPPEFDLESRSPDHRVHLGGQNLIFAPVSGPIFVSDLEGGRRRGTLADLERLVRLSETTPSLHHGSPDVALADRPAAVNHLEVLRTHIRLSVRGLIGDAWGAERARDDLEMAALVFGGREAIAGRPVLTGYVNPSSPLRYERRGLESLLEYAASGQCLIVAPWVLAGATGPVVLAGALAQTVRPGTPVMYRGFVAGLDMRTGALALGRPEAALTTLAAAQLARRYRLPFRGPGLISSSTTSDAQAGTEKALMLWALLLSGAHYVPHAAGWLEGGLTANFEQFVLDADLLEMAGRLLEGIRVEEAMLALDVIARVAPGGHFLAHPHTRDHLRLEFIFPALSDTSSYEAWAQRGEKNAAERAPARWRQLLEAYCEPPLDPGVAKALDAYVERRTRELKP